MIRPVFETSHQMGPYSPFVIFLLLGSFPLIGISLIALGIYTAYAAIVYDGWNYVTAAIVNLVPIGAPATFLLWYGWVLIEGGLAKYRFEANGLQVKYPLLPERIISWDEFQQICVVRAAFTTRGERRANTVICCVKKGEKKNIYDRWKTDNPFRYRSVICIAYTPELHEGIKIRCPYEVFDLRDTPAYRLQLARS